MITPAEQLTVPHWLRLLVQHFAFTAPHEMDMSEAEHDSAVDKGGKGWNAVIMEPPPIVQAKYELRRIALRRRTIAALEAQKKEPDYWTPPQILGEIYLNDS